MLCGTGRFELGSPGFPSSMGKKNEKIPVLALGTIEVLEGIAKRMASSHRNAVQG